MEGLITDTTYEAKSVVVHDEDQGTALPTIMLAFESFDNAALQAAGYNGRYVLFTVADGWVQESFTDPFEVDHYALGADFTEFALEVRRGWQSRGKAGVRWEDVEDGSEIHPRDMEPVEVDE